MMSFYDRFLLRVAQFPSIYFNSFTFYLLIHPSIGVHIPPCVKMNSNGTSIPSTSIAPEGAIYLATALSILEVFPIHPMVIAISIFNFVQIAQTQLLHNNLKLVLIAESAGIILYELLRWVFVVLKLFSGDIFYTGAYPLQATATFALNFRNLLIYVLMVERAFATIYYRNYEKLTRPYIAIGGIIGLILLCIWLSYTQQGSPWSPDLSTIISQLVVCGANFTLIIAIVFIFVYNNRHYHQMNRALALSHKFQLSENIRTAKQLAPTFIFHTLNAFMNNAVVFIIYFKLIERNYVISICFILIALVNALLSMLIEFTVIRHHPLLKKKALAQIRWLANRTICAIKRNNAVDDIGGGRSNNAPMALDINGNQLIQVSEPEDHFKMLKDSWK